MRGGGGGTVKAQAPKMPSVECEVEVGGPKMASVECEVEMNPAAGVNPQRSGSPNIVRGSDWRRRFTDVSCEAQGSSTRKCPSVIGVQQRAASLSPYRGRNQPRSMQKPLEGLSVDFHVKAPKMASVECGVEVEVELKAPKSPKMPSVECELECEVECEVEVKAPKSPKMPSVGCEVEAATMMSEQEVQEECKRLHKKFTQAMMCGKKYNWTPRKCVEVCMKVETEITAQGNTNEATFPKLALGASTNACLF